jgi:hypothetical protein
VVGWVSADIAFSSWVGVESICVELIRPIAALDVVNDAICGDAGARNK